MIKKVSCYPGGEKKISNLGEPEGGGEMKIKVLLKLRDEDGFYDNGKLNRFLKKRRPRKYPSKRGCQRSSSQGGGRGRYMKGTSVLGDWGQGRMERLKSPLGGR